MKKKYDIIVVGTGVAGLYFSLCVPQEKKILLITKDEIENSDSYLAQGGVCVLRGDADYEGYYEDTMRAGHYENNPETVEIMIRESRRAIEKLIEFGTEFDRDSDGELHYTKEGAHRKSRILHHKDQTGKEIMRALIATVRTRENITIEEHCTMMDLIEKNNECLGIVTERQDGARQAVYADAVVLATGGVGGLFKHSTNFPHITGDGIAVCLKHGVELENINYVQIHPTTLYTTKKERSFLISESVRGEGAILVNGKGERFTDELQPRDVVAAAIQREMEKEGTDHVYLTLVSKTDEEAKERFPYIYNKCREEGYNLTKDRVPVTPAQHYLMGGIKANNCGETSMKRLFAVGETACNGVHGRNRLASNSLLESLVFSERAAKKACELTAGTEDAVEVDLNAYPGEQAREAENREIIMGEIKRKDPEFYDKWCKY